MYTQSSGSRAREIKQLVGDYPVDVKGFRTNNKAWLLDEIYAMSRKHFAVGGITSRTPIGTTSSSSRSVGIDRLHHGASGASTTPRHVQHVPGNSRSAKRFADYYRHLDEEPGSILELPSTDDTAVLVVSDHGAQRLDGGFCVNEWLIREGLLVLNSYPEQVTPFSKLDVNWDKTRVWSEGGYYARVFFNV